eukprot:CAMPEP_0181028344 /NCGR_PEP_ID=MMETSP1070-20121207/4622_1 /TAXON_ID=265543 /ORGANISM="Minutocellus polymorphus, Strain NH13" /LENGTH=293 /DNA_ID=CAMNT_0023105595 /DNA_START=71 /DNA_END=951 /DNA_ORIENTATION=+
MKGPSLLLGIGTLAVHHANTLVLALSTSTPAAAASDRTSPAEVKQMFDDFAPSFESKLIDSLKYSAPKECAQTASNRIDNRQGRRYSSCLDAGCGTGLSGPHLRPLVDGTFVGVDLSPKMAEMAAELVRDDGPTPTVPDRMRRCTESARLGLGGIDRLYDGIFIGDLLDLQNAEALDGFGFDMTSFPSSESEPFDLIVSADVLCYFGDMRGVLKSFANRLAVGGDLIFSTETMKAGDYNWVQLQSERYAHCADYVRRMAEDAGLKVVSQMPFTPRMEAGEKVLGTLHTFAKEE